MITDIWKDIPYTKKKEQLKRVLFSIIISVVLILIIKNPVYNALGVI